MSLNLVPGSEQVEKDRLVHPLLAEFEVVAVHRRFGTVVRRNIVPGAPGGQNVQDTVEQPLGSHRYQPVCNFVDGKHLWTISQRSPSIFWNAMIPGFI